MSMDKIRQARQGLFDRVVEDMKAGGAQWREAWSFPAPRNPKTGTVYRGRNALLLTYYMRAEGIEDPRFMTFNQAKEEGFKVAKGCHAYPIEKWMRIAYLRDDPAKRIKQPKTPKEWKAVEADPDMGTKYVVVGSWNLFNAADIEGIAPYEPPAGIVSEAEAVDFLIENSPCKVHEVAGDSAFYRPATDEITVPLRGQFANETAMARVLLHEQAHATGAEGRLAREKGGAFGSEGYAREELTAELSSLFTANELGLRLPAVGRDDAFAESEYWQSHVAYLQSWSSRFEDPASELMQAASRAGAASDWLMDNCFEPALARRRAPDAPAPVLARRTERIPRKAPGEPKPADLDRDLRAASEAARSRTEPSRKAPCMGKE